MVAGVVCLTAEALGMAIVPVDCLLLVPPIILFTMVPISLAGWGVREGAMVVGFGLVGVPAADALALSVTFGLVNAVTGLPGGLLWLIGERRLPPALFTIGSVILFAITVNMLNRRDLAAKAARDAAAAGAKG